MADNKICPHCGKPVPPTALGDLCPECMLKAGLATQTEGPDAAGEGGTRFVPPSIGEIARLFPQLEILRLIGQGGMGAVYKARQPALDRFVALKVLPPAAAGDPGFAERFNREARALARLNHPNIVAVHDFGRAGTLHYLVMEFVDGANLREVEQLGELTPEQALAIVPQICEALQFAHNEGIVHRDIKPENLLLDKKGRVKITDFGIAKMVGVGAGPQNLTGAKDVVGTPHYMAPEQIEKPLSVDHRADIYSLGVVFYEMLTGELPLGKFQPPSKKVQIDVRLDEVVLHALEKEPDRRYQQASQVKTAVETIVTTPGVSGPVNQSEAVPTATQIEAVRQSLKIPARGLIAAGVLLLLFALGLLVFAMPAIASEGGSPAGYAAVCFGAAVLMLAALIVLHGANSMLKLRNYPFSVVASVVAAFAGPGGILGLPFGVWAVVVLNRPEVRAAFRANQPLAAAPDSRNMDFARSQVKGPAIGLVVTGVLDWVLMAIACGVVGFKSPGNMFIWLPFLAIVLSGWIIYAGLKLMQLERRGAVMSGSVLAILVSPGNIIGLPLGIWTLVVLNRRDVREAFEANRQPETKTVTISGETQDQLSPAATALRHGTRVGLWVFVLIVGAATIITLLLPKDYVATALVRLTGPEPADPYRLQTEAEIIQSQPVLESVAASLNLSQRWGEKFDAGRAPSDDQTLVWMKQRIDVQPRFHTALVEIRFYSDSPAEAAEIANKIMATYCALPPAPRGNIIERAMVPSHPVRPNVALNIFLGMVAGGVLGIFTGTWVGLISYWRLRRASLPSTQKPDRFWRHFAVAVAVILFALVSIPVVLVLLAMLLPAFNATRNRMDTIHVEKVAQPPATTNFYIGQAWFPQGDSIEINSVERTPERMVVKGDYNLVCHDHALLEFSVTSTNQNVPEDASQWTNVSKGHGDFELIHPYLDKTLPGLPHVSMYADGHPFASLYFGNKAEALEESKAGWITNAAPTSVLHNQEPEDLREARARLAELRVDYSEQSLVYQKALARVNELARMTREEPDAPADLREAKARLAELRVDYAEQNPRVQEALDRIKVLEQENSATAETSVTSTTNAYPASALQFRLVLSRDSTEPADSIPSASEQDRFLLSRQVLLDDTAIARAGVDFDPFGRRMIEIRFTDTGARKFEAITATNIGRQLAIVFRGRVLSAPVIQSVIPSGGCQVNGSMSAGEINEIVDCLNRTATPTAEIWNFSPFHEQILPFNPQPKAMVGWLDLDSGGFFLTNPTLDWQSRSGHDWIQTRGLDVVTTESAKHFPTLLGIDMIIAPAPTNGWEVVTPADVIHDWRLLQEEPQQKQVFGAIPGQTNAFIFQTREGGKGILQILGFADNPPGVKVRYKLVQSSKSREAIDPATGFPALPHSTRIDPNTGLPLSAGSTNVAIDPATGLPTSPGETGAIDPVTGLPVAPAATKGQ